MVAVQDVRALVQGYLQRNCDVVELRQDQFLIRRGSSACSIVCHDWGDGNVIVKLMALVLSDVPVTEALYERIGREAGTHLFGKMMMVEEPGGEKGDLFFHHTLLGDFLEEAELMFALVAVLETADELDDMFQADFGGQRVRDQESQG